MSHPPRASASFFGLLDSLKEEYERLLSENSQLRFRLEAEVLCPTVRSSEQREEASADFATDEANISQTSKIAHLDCRQEGGTDNTAESTGLLSSNVAPLMNQRRVVDLDDDLEFCDVPLSTALATLSEQEHGHHHASILRPLYVMLASWNDHAELLQEKFDVLDYEHSFRSGETSTPMLRVATRHGDSNSICQLVSQSQQPRYEFFMVLMIHPASNRRTVWGLAGAALLMYDLVIVPMDVCFELDHGAFLSTMVLIARIFWTLDIPMSFLTGVVHEGTLLMHPQDVAYVYIRSWFAFDITLVLTEWLTMWMEDLGSNASPASAFRLFRFSRMLRLLRVLRLIKIAKMKPFLCNLVLLSSPGLDSVTACVKINFALVVSVHVAACVWHIIGDSLHNGWVASSGLKNASDARKYVMSLRWILLHSQANNNGLRISTSIEYIFDSVVIWCGFLFCAAYVGVVMNMLISLASSNVSRVHAMARRYTLRHKLRYDTTHRLEQCLAVNQFGGPVEILTEEQILIAAIPMRLQMDILFEVRLAMTQQTTFFADMFTRTPRVLRALTHRMDAMAAVARETWFAVGDVSTHMLFITEGRFCYECDESLLSTTPRPECRPRHTSSQDGMDVLVRGAVLSEAALWTTWEHLGKFWAYKDSIVVAIDKDNFAKEILAHHRATAHAVKYARHFCWRLNRVEACDVTGFDLDLAALDTDLYIGGQFDHFAFVSHYKLEAGTEATLIKDEMEQMIKKGPCNPAGDFRTPIFVDSENLFDLSRLADHVRGSLALILLLTPGLLSRPWCLLEIVTAQNCGRPYVPVLLTHPGVNYVFPDEDFYAKLHKDEIIAGGAEGRKLLEENGINLEEVETAIRSIFMMIALPYSPHKSAAVRAAEMSDIMKRCMTVTGDSLKALGYKSSTYGSDDFKRLQSQTKKI